MPRKVFVAGEILTAADVNTNLMDQAVMVFDDSAARGSAIPSPSEGMVTYLKDTDAVEKYDGAAFVNVDTGKILQVVSTTKTDSFSASVGAGAISGDVTGLTATITPSAASSKVLVNVALSGVSTGGLYATLFRDGTALSGYQGDSAGSRQQVSGTIPFFSNDFAGSNMVLSFLDSPSSTSALTYSVRLRHDGSGTVSVFVNRSTGDSDSTRGSRSASTITLMEVAG
jgi:hypothetical protein